MYFLGKKVCTFWAKSIYFSAKRYTPFLRVACISFKICAPSHSNIGQIMLQNAPNYDVKCTKLCSNMGHIVWQKHRFYCIVSRDLLSNIRQAAPTKPA